MPRNWLITIVRKLTAARSAAFMVSLSGALCFAGVRVSAQDYVAPATQQRAELTPTQELQELYERLEAAEQQIRDLSSLQPAAYEAQEISYEGESEEGESSLYALAVSADDKKKPKTLESRLDSIEKAMKKDADSASKKKADDAKKPTAKWTGRIHADYWGFPEASAGAEAMESAAGGPGTVDRFLFRRVRIGIAGDIPDLMMYKLEVDFNNPNQPQYKDMYFGWKERPLLGTVLLGNQKRPYGLDHLNSSRYNVFIERPFIVEAFNQDARRFGVCSYKVSENEAWNTRLGAYMSQDIQNAGTVFATPGDCYQAEVAGRIANTIWYDESSDGRGYAHWGISSAYCNTSINPANTTANFNTRPEARTVNRWLNTGGISGAEDYQLVGLEGLVNLGPMQVCGEYMHNWVNRTGNPDVDFGGGYIYLSYFLTGEHMVWDRESGTLGRVKPFQHVWSVRDRDGDVQRGWGAWQVAVRYSRADLNDANVLGGEGDSVTAGVNWYLNSYSKFQFNCIKGNIENRAASAASGGATSADYTIIGVRGMVDF